MNGGNSNCKLKSVQIGKAGGFAVFSGYELGHAALVDC